MSDVSYWKSQLPTKEELDLLEEENPKVVLIRDEPSGKEKYHHSAAGDDTFGRLTSLGIQQMISVGQALRSDLLSMLSNNANNNNNKDNVIIHPGMIHVASTDFPRTILSAKSVIQGLFHTSTASSKPPFNMKENGNIEIDLRYTTRMIPDPKPRLYTNQLALETQITTEDAKFISKEKEMYPLAVRISNVLYEQNFVDAAKASLLSFGVGEDKDDKKQVESSEQQKYPILSWIQLAEISHCLMARNLLPLDFISSKDYNDIMNYVAWRWFYILSNADLSKMALKSLIKKIVWNAYSYVEYKEQDGNEEGQQQPLLYLFSAHDATLIGLMCGLHMEQPSQWPDYGSFLKVELFEDEKGVCLYGNCKEPKRGSVRGIGALKNEDEQIGPNYYLRFSLNNQVLKSKWGSRSIIDGDNNGADDHERGVVYREFIPLEEARDAVMYLEESLLG